jgi:hypothetical protein
MIYQFVLLSLGPHGRWLLDFVVDKQLPIMSVVFLLLVIERFMAVKKGKNIVE